MKNKESRLFRQNIDFIFDTKAMETLALSSWGKKAYRSSTIPFSLPNSIFFSLSTYMIHPMNTTSQSPL